MMNINRLLQIGDRRRNDQRGMTLMEILVAIVVLGIGSSGVAFATFGSLRSANIARTQSDMNVLATSFGEAVKVLPYETCASTSDYLSMFESRDDSIPEELFRLQGRLGANLQVLSVTDKMESLSRCPGGDSGVQLVELRASNDRASRTIQVVKRNPALSSTPPHIDFDIARRSQINSPIVEFGLIPKVSSEVGVFRYEWWCQRPGNTNDDWLLSGTPSGAVVTPNRPADFEYLDSSPMDPKCAKGSPGDGEYQPLPAAGHGGAETYYYAALRITDNAGITWPAVGKQVVMPDSTVFMPPSTAGIRQLSTPACTKADPCTVGQEHTFDGSLSLPGDGTAFLKCLWTFSDGSDPEVYLGSDCTTRQVKHKFFKPGDVDASNTWVRLSITDGVGRVVSDTRYLEINGIPRVPPTVVIRAGTVPQAAWANPANSDKVFGKGSLIPGRAPQKYYLSAVGSQSNEGGTLSYEWRFDDDPNAVETSATPSYTFNFPSTPLTGSTCVVGSGDVVQGAYRIRLIVRDSTGVEASASLCVRIGEDLPKPPVFGYRGANEVWCPSYALGFICEFWKAYAVYQFSWANVPMAPGDKLEFRYRVVNVYGASCVIGQSPSSGHAIDYNVVWTGDSGTGARRDNGFFAAVGSVFSDLNYRISTSCMYQVQTKRTTADGVVTDSAWSSPSPMKAG